MSFLNGTQQQIIKDFIIFVKKELELNTTPSICVQNNRDGIKTTANYNYSGEKKIIRVYGKGRAIVDILRSIAHEMVHHKQWEEGRLSVKPQDIGGEIEDESNAKAGVFIKKFSKITPEIYEE